MRRHAGALLTLLLIALWTGPSAHAHRDPFGVNPQGADHHAADAAPASRASPWDRAVIYVRLQQQKFYRQLSGAVKRLKSEGSLTAAWALVALSFLYGIFHAAGPGHGKAVITAYVLANREQIRRGALLSGAAALVQALSAIVMVSLFVLLMKATGLEAQQSIRQVELISYGLVVALGLWLLWGALRKRDPVDHAHDHHGECGHAHFVAPGRARPVGWQQDLSVVLSVGARPCGGAVVVLLFAYTLGIYGAGIGATLAMSVGTGLTVATLASGALLTKRLTLAWLGHESHRARVVLRWLQIGGALAIVVLGILLLEAALGNRSPFL